MRDIVRGQYVAVSRSSIANEYGEQYADHRQPLLESWKAASALAVAHPSSSHTPTPPYHKRTATLWRNLGPSLLRVTTRVGICCISSARDIACAALRWLVTTFALRLFDEPLAVCNDFEHNYCYCCSIQFPSPHTSGFAGAGSSTIVADRTDLQLCTPAVPHKARS